MFVFLIIVIIIVYIIYIKTNHVRKLAAQFPGKRTLPLLGNLHHLGFTVQEFLGNLLCMSQEYKFDVYRIFIGPKLFVVMTNPDDVGEILTNMVDFEKPDIFHFFKPWLGEGLFTSEDQVWKLSRKIIAPTFHTKLLESFEQITEQQGDKLISKLMKVADGNVVNIWEFISRCALDIISEAALGVNVNAQDHFESEIVESIDNLCNIIMNRVLNPLKVNDMLFNLSWDATVQNKALRILTDFNNSAIKKRRNYLEQELKRNKVENDNNENSQRRGYIFLDTLLLATIDGEPLTHKQIMDEVSTYLFTAHDSITAAVNFALYNLANNPEIQEKVLQEQIELLGTNITRNETVEELQKMKYLDLFIKESLRLYSSAPIIGRRAKKDIDINGKILPAGCTVMVFVYGMHRNPRTFPDPYKVDPERFLPENRTNKHPFDYIPFSAGRRNCVGQKLGLIEMKTLLSKLVRNFEFTSAGSENAVIPYVSVSLKSVNGVRICVRPRKYKCKYPLTTM